MPNPAKPRPCTEAGLPPAAVKTVLVMAVLIYWVRDTVQLAMWRTELDVALHSAMATAGVHFALRAIGFATRVIRLAWDGVTKVVRAAASWCVTAWRWTTSMMRAAAAWCARHITFSIEFKFRSGEREPRSA